MESQRGDNLAGLCSIAYVLASNVVSIPPIDRGNISGNVVLAAGITWTNLPFAQNSGHFIEKVKNYKGSMVFEPEVSFSIGTDEPSSLAECETLMRARIFLMVTDNNGRKRLCGTLPYGCDLNIPRDTGLQPGQRAGYTFAISWQSTRPTPFYQNEITLGTGITTCPTLAELIAAASVNTLKAALVTAGKLSGIVASLLASELYAWLTTAQEDDLIDLFSVANIIAWSSDTRLRQLVAAMSDTNVAQGVASDTDNIQLKYNAIILLMTTSAIKASLDANSQSANVLRAYSISELFAALTTTTLTGLVSLMSAAQITAGIAGQASPQGIRDAVIAAMSTGQINSSLTTNGQAPAVVNSFTIAQLISYFPNATQEALVAAMAAIRVLNGILSIAPTTARQAFLNILIPGLAASELGTAITSNLTYWRSLCAAIGTQQLEYGTTSRQKAELSGMHVLPMYVHQTGALMGYPASNNAGDEEWYMNPANLHSDPNVGYLYRAMTPGLQYPLYRTYISDFIKNLGGTHKYRLCGYTGGYWDGSAYKSISGSTTTKALAFPDDFIIDTQTGIGYKLTTQGTYSTFAAAMSAAESFSTVINGITVTEWRASTLADLYAINGANNQTWNFTPANAPANIQTSTPRATGASSQSKYATSADMNTSEQAKSGATQRFVFCVNYFLIYCR